MCAYTTLCDIIHLPYGFVYGCIHRYKDVWTRLKRLLSSQAHCRYKATTDFLGREVPEALDDVVKPVVLEGSATLAEGLLSFWLMTGGLDKVKKRLGLQAELAKVDGDVQLKEAVLAPLVEKARNCVKFGLSSAAPAAPNAASSSQT